MIECESIMADKGLICMVKGIGMSSFIKKEAHCLIIIIMVIFKCYFSGELIALS